MVTLILANEYLAWPIFCPDLENMGHVDAEDLPLSHELINEINVWDQKYQATFNSAYPPDSEKFSPEEAARHTAEGAIIAEKMQQELGRNYTVIFHYLK